MTTSIKHKKADTAPSQEDLAKVEADRLEGQNVVLSGDEAREAAEANQAYVSPTPATTFMKIGDEDSGPRTYAEAVEKGTMDDKDEYEGVVVNPTSYEAAVEAVAKA